MNTASGQWCLISGIHFSLAFFSDTGAITLKHTRNMSVCKYKTLHLL